MNNSKEKLTEDFLIELFRLILIKPSLLERVAANLKYQYLPSPSHKQILKTIIDSYNVNKQMPTIGTLGEIYKNEDKTLALLSKIKNSEIVTQEVLLPQLEKYIKDIRFSELWDETIALYNKSDRDGARKLMAEESAKINDFSIFKSDSNFVHVFGDFQKRMIEKELQKERGEMNKKLIPTGILPFDLISGGIDKKETALFILRSGVGKSTILKYIGMYACRMGYRVLHIQCEGSEEECFDKYTQNWTALPYSSVKYNNIDSEVFKKLKKISEEAMSNLTDIDIKAFEQFDEMTMLDARDCVVQYIKENGVKPDLLLLDSIDLAHPGDGLKYGVDTQSVKMKIQNASRKFKNICNEFDLAGATVMQTADVKMEVWNDPNKHLTRSDSMADKNIANSYSFVITGNQTLDEEKKEMMRMYFDKVRHHGLKLKIYPICTKFGLGRFYDNKRTLKMFSEIYTND